MDDGHWNMKIYYLSKGNFTLKKKTQYFIISISQKRKLLNLLS